MSARLASLFAGIGGFELAAKDVGIELAWTSEVDAACNRVLDAHFPSAAHLGDVSQIDPEMLAFAEVITAGSPCQGFSIAGAGRGMQDERSGLFEHFVRIAHKARPRFAVWENVPGALTSNKGEDFANVIGALVGSSEPLPLPKHPSGRRSRYAGVAHGPAGTLAWRVLDAQHFGVAQRRQRIFAVLDTQGWDSIPILFPDEGGFPSERVVNKIDVQRGSAWASCWDLDGLPTGMDVGAHPKVRLAEVLEPEVDEHYYLSAKACQGILRRATRRGKELPAVLDYALRCQAGEDVGEPPVGEPPVGEVDKPLTAHPGGYRLDHETEDFVPVMMKQREGKPGGGKGPLLSPDLSLTIATGNDQLLFEPHPFRKVKRAQTSEDFETWEQAEASNTLNTFDVGDARATDVVVEPTYSIHAAQDPITLDDISLPLESKNGSYASAVSAPPTYRVRRLTPTECERLQGFPDGWTALEGTKDGPRYRQLGNAVAVPVARWVLGRVAEALR